MVVLGINNRWANRHTGSVEVYTQGRKFIHVDIEPTQIGRIFTPTAGYCFRRGRRLGDVYRSGPRVESRERLKDRSAWLHDCQQRKAALHRKTTSTTCRSSRNGCTKR